MRLVDAEPIVEEFWKPEYRTQTRRDFIAVIDKSPTIDAVPVVKCQECMLHGNCTTEDVFHCSGMDMAEAFCCAGKRKDGDGNG